VEVGKFSTERFFSGPCQRLQLALPLPGWALLRMNAELLQEARREQPNAILFWRPTHVLPKTVRAIRRLGIQVISYNNDDPFGPKAYGNCPWHHHWLWFWFLRCVPIFDVAFFYRKVNRQEAIQHGARRAEILLPYFSPWEHHQVMLNLHEREQFKSDVVFVGHYEPDGRAEGIRALMEAGIAVKIWSGGDWPRQALGHFYDLIQPIEPALGPNYAKALSGAKICLAFLSKLNRDTYTRRCFEIPACGRPMLAERTADLMSMFKEDEEACYFSSPKELVEKAQWLLKNPEIRKRIAAAGRQRVFADGHDVISRARQFLINIS